MTLRKRILKVTLSMPAGDVVLDDSIYIHARIEKAALAIQNKAVLEIMGLSTSLREQLLSQFTAWNKRQVETGQIAQDWINITIEAGYATPASTVAAASGGFATPASSQTSVIFKGQVTLCELASGPPNIAVRITCYTQQINKTAFISSQAPAQTTFYNYVKWAAQEMGFGNNFICDTSFNDVVIYNAGRSRYIKYTLLIDIQDKYKPDIAAFVDDDMLIVKDRDKIINPSSISNVTSDQIIGTPCWNEWGVEFTTMYDPTIKLAQATAITSLMNPGVSGTYVITSLEYDLASRNGAWYLKSSGSPPA